MLKLKKCSICGINKELDQFYSQKKSSKKLGKYIYYHPECKECAVQKAVQWRKDNLQRSRELDKKYLQTEKGKKMRKRKIKKYIVSGKRAEWEEKNKDKLKGYIEYKSMHVTHTITDKEWEECKNYFNYRCAYCDLKIEDHWVKFNKDWILGDFHREHVDHEGSNDLSNCVPSCKKCNSRKWKYEFGQWYDENNPIYDKERHEKIIRWLETDYEKYIEKELISE